MLPTPKFLVFTLLFSFTIGAQIHISEFKSMRKGAMTNEIKLPSTHKFQVIIEEGDLRTTPTTGMPDKFDFTGYVPISGSSENGYLSINSEMDAGAVTIMDISFDTNTKLWSWSNATDIDFTVVSGTSKNCSGTVTPWNTIITCEENVLVDGADADSRNDIGWCIEIDPLTKTVGTTENPEKLWALGNMRHENVVIDPKAASNNRVVYFGEDVNNGFVYKFVAEVPKNFTDGYDSSAPAGSKGGKLYVYKGSKNGFGQWVLLNNLTDNEQNTIRSQSNAAAGTMFNGGVEDVEINPIDGHIYFAVKGLGESCIYKIVDPDPLSEASIPSMSKYVGGKDTEYEVSPGVLEKWGDGTDNLAFDNLGNLWVMQDDSVNTEGFIWVVENGHVDGINDKAKIFAQVPIGAEPTGITFSPDFRFLFMSIMHPSGSNNGTQKDAAGVTLTNNLDAAIVIARNEELGTTYVYDSVWVGGTPSVSSPSYSDIVIKNGDAALTQSMTCYKVIVNPGASLTINSGVTLTVEDEMILESQSDSYASLLLNGTITGTIKYERFVNAQDNRNDLIAPPLDGQSWSDFLTIDSDKNNPNSINIFNDGGDPTTYLYGPFEKGTTDNYVTYNSSTSTGLTSGKGYRAATNNISALKGAQLTFTGSVVTNNPFTVNIENDVTGTYPEWNLIGNPFPSYINVHDFLNHQVGIDPITTNKDLMDASSVGIYGYDADASGTGYWTIYNLSSPSNTTMAPGQGFFVSADVAKVTSYDMEFTSSMRKKASEGASADDFIVGRAALNNVGHLELQILNGINNYLTDFYFDTNASLGLDPGYDAAMFGGTAPAFSVYSHLVEDNTGIPMAIQALGPNEMSNVTIPLGIHAPQGTSITISISKMDLPPTIDVYLEDNDTNTFTLLNTGDYVFTANETLNTTGRFFLRFEDRALGIDETPLNGLNIYTDYITETIWIKGMIGKNTIAKLYDIQGRLVVDKTLDAQNNKNSIDISKLIAGVYIVHLKNTHQTKTQKVVIK